MDLRAKVWLCEELEDEPYERGFLPVVVRGPCEVTVQGHPTVITVLGQATPGRPDSHHKEDWCTGGRRRRKLEVMVATNIALPVPVAAAVV